MNMDLYRPGVGVMLLNAQRHVWVGQRLDSTLEAWQMPQGGLDPGEEALEGAMRELEQETGIRPHLVEIVARARQELTYDLPEDLIGKVWKQPWRGQRQAWVLARFLGDGRIDRSNNAAERALRGIAIGRKAWLFVGSDRGGERAAAIYALITTAKLNDVDPRAWLAEVLARINDHPAARLHELLPWNWKPVSGEAAP